MKKIEEKNWLNELAQKRQKLNMAPVELAYHLINEENYRLIGQQITNALVKLNCDEETLCAALLYPSYKAKKISNEKIIKTCGKSIHKLLLGTEKMDAIDDINISHKTIDLGKIDNLRKMLLAMVDDIRVVLIKLSERLSALRQLKNADPARRKIVANQVMQIYGPLANRLGIGQLKWRLEDLAFRYLEPEAYRPIAKHLKLGQEAREKFVEQMIRKLENLLKNQGLEKFSISGRAKHIYSIHQKLKRKGVDFTKLYDASAFRILVPTLKDCYTALSIVHSTWEPISEEFDDYIANPKPNGYQSIHTAIRDQNGINVEIQIRTFEMHNTSERGIAAHWKYKEGSGQTSAYEEKINRLRQVIEWQKELNSQQENSDDIFQKMFEDRIYVFTPRGDIFDLETGATSLDFAYHLHTEVGHRCRGTKVNNILVPLTQVLHTGDHVEILTAKESKPSRDWLNPNLHYLKTKTAMAKVRHWFNRIDRENELAWGITLPEKELHKTAIKKAKIEVPLKPLKEAENKSPQLDVLGTTKLLTKIAKCCQATRKDEILGYITKNRGISIHLKTCLNIQNSARNHPERIIEINWTA